MSDAAGRDRGSRPCTEASTNPAQHPDLADEEADALKRVFGVVSRIEKGANRGGLALALEQGETHGRQMLGQIAEAAVGAEDDPGSADRRGAVQVSGDVICEHAPGSLRIVERGGLQRRQRGRFLEADRFPG